MSTKFVKGQSGNPAGRPKGFAGVARDILKRTKDGKELVTTALAIMRSKKAANRDRLAALQWLSDRALGRPLATVDLNVNGELDVSAAVDVAKMSEDELRRIADGLADDEPD